MYEGVYVAYRNGSFPLNDYVCFNVLLVFFRGFKDKRMIKKIWYDKLRPQIFF